MKNFALVGAGGFLGSIARYAVTLAVSRVWTREFPLGTFLVNVSGCWVLSFFMAFALGRTTVDPGWRLLIATGFLGAYTTFSTLQYESEGLAKAGAPALALANVLGSVLAGYGALRLGAFMAR
ncbi:MAG: fluoride efflux transporter CrcB [Acidobacteriota bacterium]